MGSSTRVRTDTGGGWCRRNLNEPDVRECVPVGSVMRGWYTRTTTWNGREGTVVRTHVRGTGGTMSTTVLMWGRGLSGRHGGNDNLINVRVSDGHGVGRGHTLIRPSRPLDEWGSSSTTYTLVYVSPMCPVTVRVLTRTVTGRGHDCDDGHVCTCVYYSLGDREDTT